MALAARGNISVAGGELKVVRQVNPGAIVSVFLTCRGGVPERSTAPSDGAPAAVLELSYCPMLRACEELD